MKKGFYNNGLRKPIFVRLLTAVLIWGAACTEGVDEDKGMEVGDLSEAQIVSRQRSKVEASVWRHFEGAEGDNATDLRSAASKKPLRILVFHRFSEPFMLSNLSFGRATNTHLGQLAAEVASQQDEVVKRVVEFNAQKVTGQPQLRILDRPQYNYFVTMEVASRADVEWLAQKSWVTAVREDKLNELFTVEGRNLVGSDVVERSGYDGNGIGIAIIDTHFDLLHPELGGSTSLPNGVVFGGDNLSDPGTPIHSQNLEDCYHGTGTLSIAKRYATGADMYGLTVFPNAYDSVIVTAINWCINNRHGINGGAPIRIISMSFGGGGYTDYCSDDTMGQAAGNALAVGIVPFAATGNDGFTDMIGSPSCSPNVIAVGSVWDVDGANYNPFPPTYCSDSDRLVNERACYSNTASIIDVYAPSEEVICALCGGGSWALGGTSSACPAAAGMTAQLIDAMPGLIGDINGILQLYQSTGVTVIGDNDEVRIDLAAAVASGDSVSTVGFDPEFYLSHYADLKAAFGDDHQAALEHWLHYGANEGRRPCRQFDPVFYLDYYSDLLAAFGAGNYLAAYNHWLEYGVGEGRRGSREFDVAEYLSLYADLSTAFGTDYAAALDHWITYGLNEGRRSSREFDVKFYLNHYPDLLAVLGTDNFTAAFDHWLEFGMNEGRRISYEFDVHFYLNHHPDLLDTFGDGNFPAAYHHFITYGLNEGRSASSDFDVHYYLNRYPDLIAAFGEGNYPAAFDHWIVYGRQEGRQGTP